MSDDPARLEVNFQVGGDVPPREMDELTMALRRELLQLDVDSVDRVSAGPVPEGAKGVDLAAIGALIVSLGSATPVLGQVVDVIRAWSARSPERTVSLTLGGDTLVLGGMSSDDQHLVIKDWMARHAPPPKG